MFKAFLKKILDLPMPFIYKRLEYYRKKQNEQKITHISKKFQSVGVGFKLNGDNFTIRSPKKIILGNNIHIGNNVYIAAEGGLIIKDNTHISRNVTIYTVNHDYKGNALPYDEKTVYKAVTIGKNVWIGMNVCILPGIKIGDGAIIGMGSVVNRNVSDLEIVGNDSLKSLKYRPKEAYINLESSQKYGGVNGKLLSHQDIKSFKKTYHQNRHQPIVFVLSTGRSGSKTIVDVFNQNPKIKAFHEDIYQLIRISSQLTQTDNSKDSIYQELEDIFQTKIWQAAKGQILVHSDLKLWNLVSYLMDYFTNSKFIHLERDAIPCIKSMMARKWYDDNEYPHLYKHDWAKYRLSGYEVGEFTKEEWIGLSQLHKCTWYWFYVNQQIDNQLKSLNDSRKLKINLSSLDVSLTRLSSFLETEEFDYKQVISNKVREVDRLQYKELSKTMIDEDISKFLQQLKGL